MKKFLKFFIGLFLLPACCGASRLFFCLLRSIPSGNSGWDEWALPAGFLVSAVGFFLLPPAFRTYVLGHELTHALWGVMMGAKVEEMKISASGGHVELTRTNFLISLAPYFFPFYAALVVGFWFLVNHFFDMSQYKLWWMAAVGLAWGFHITFTVYMLCRRQPDIQENGRLFSYVIIYLANLFFVSLWVIAFSEMTLGETFSVFRDEMVLAYSTTWSFLGNGWAYVQDLLSKFK